MFINVKNVKLVDLPEGRWSDFSSTEIQRIKRIDCSAVCKMSHGDLQVFLWEWLIGQIKLPEGITPFLSKHV